MAGEIEKYLVSKLIDAIQEIESTEQDLLAKLTNLPSKFQELKKLLQPPVTSAAANGQNVSKLSRENLYYLNNLLTEWQMQSKKQKFYFPQSIYFAVRFASNLDKIKEKLPGAENSATPDEEITQQSSTSSGTESEPFRWSTRDVDATKVYGLDEKAMSLQRLLIIDNTHQFKAIGIVGICGVGKTTLCQLIFNKQEVKNHFLPRIWACTSKQPGDDRDNRKEIVKRVLKCLGVEKEIIESAGNSHGLKGLLFALRLQLMGKKYLIVLDDVRSTDEEHEDFYSFLGEDEKCGERLGYGFPRGCGGRVVITSRREELVKKMVGEENLHRLLPLSDGESCWSIFKDSVEKDGKKLTPDLELLRENIVRKCDGLPLAAKRMGQIAHQQLPDC